MSGAATPAAGTTRLAETEAVLELRHAVRAWLTQHDLGAEVAVALSGGADSLALTAAAVVECAAVDALIVDHGLQPGSAAVAATAAATALKLGCRSAHVLPVEVGRDGGMEAAARKARYAALDAARDGLPVLLGHTLDDQAETVLLGLARGSGPRSIQGMAPYTPPWGRPLLGVRRGVTRQCCDDLGLTPHEDPHNDSPEFTRVRLRTEVLPLLEDVLGGGVTEALGRTAAQLREDNAVLDELAHDLLRVASHQPGQAPGGPHEVTLSCETLATAPAALRRRAIRAWLLDGGAKALTGKHLHAVDQLVTAWRGQGAVAVGGGEPGTRLVAGREHGRLTLAQTDRVRPGERE
ncbi:tRNA lysidine(34) synthetase TilS [Nocardia cyriacigeorgica]|uniref:tRNA(Ile)-lysidine synthase n=1 Tax=Nocardia cyriacigeorgica (strain GUH-2) TaxID=1127134 RepID=H6RAX6_NOCCG|nr:tRNA lysidine(34) synthetase TilS [Nocardia cyriacigeorgica]CCF61215.1 tRNA(Ile)-lysidine synthase (tRNA(Ile)-lysidine synthetase) (tRNA(Ile)-2-lysyl-cytidine synthase) [Nocardia cyriacigeorgica GUH-2]